MVPTIFVAMPAVEDTEIVPAVENAFKAAKFPERVFVGVSLLDLDKSNYKKLLKLKKQFKNVSISYEKINKKNIMSQVGLGRGRYAAQALYRDQDYFLQVDGHSYFKQGWDEEFISLYLEAKETLPVGKFVLTALPGQYKYHPVRKYVETMSQSGYTCYEKFTLWSDCVPKWSHGLLERSLPDKFYPSVKFHPACAFGDREFAKNTGVDVRNHFYDEDLIYSINLFDMGYSFVFPNIKKEFPIAHLNYDAINEHGGQRKFFTEMLTPAQDVEFTNRMKARFLEFVNDPANQDKIRKYETYANITMRFGAKSHRYMPADYNRP